MTDFDPQKMDDAAVDAERELSEQYPVPELTPGIEAMGSWMVKWIPTAGYKRLGRILREYAKKEE